MSFTTRSAQPGARLAFLSAPTMASRAPPLAATAAGEDQGAPPPPPVPTAPEPTVGDRLAALEGGQADHETRIVACETRLGLQPADAGDGDGGEPTPAKPDPSPATAASVLDAREIYARHGAHRAAMAAKLRGRAIKAPPAPTVPGKPVPAGTAVLDAKQIYARLRAARAE